ncbi:MAG: (d)CMP kinase [Oscillospiraceae bacterium]|nr:(d)CMP kinase [Oscillospiraceae bacterium]
MSFVSVAIDGPAGAGKSTIARRVANDLGYLYVDTGAIYRTVGLFAKRMGADPRSEAEMTPLLDQLRIDMKVESDGIQHMYLNGEDVTNQIREPEVSMLASAVSALPVVRAFLLDMQRDLAKTRDVLMDGRDIGTVVLPDAQVKIFLTAKPEVRALRRWKELREKGKADTYDEVLSDVIKRDYDDSHRAIAPLRQAEDAYLADTSDLTLEESIQLILNTIKEKI